MSWKDDLIPQYGEHHKNQAQFYTYMFICCVLGTITNFFINGISDWVFTVCIALISILCLDKRRRHWKNYHLSTQNMIEEKENE